MNKHLYAVGQILYATAICDRRMHPTEAIILKEALEEYARVYNADKEYKVGESDSSDAIIGDIMSKKQESMDYFENFKKYYEGFKGEFSPELKSLIMRSVNSIASSYSRQNKSEIILVAKTRLLLKPE